MEKTLNLNGVKWMENEIQFILLEAKIEFIMQLNIKMIAELTHRDANEFTKELEPILKDIVIDVASRKLKPEDKEDFLSHILKEIKIPKW
jgi:hypothetical protein